MSTQNTILLQYERLQRHYNSALYTYDSISMLDLVHTLRIWTELKSEIKQENFVDINKPIFVSSTPIKTIKKITKGRDYVWVGFGKTSVNTYAANGEILYCPFYKDKIAGTIGAKIKRLENNGLAILTVHFCKSQIDEPYIKNEALLIQNINSSKFDHWLGTEAVRIYYQEKNLLITISREMLIKRLANTLDASHPQKDKIDDNNRFDQYINELLTYTCGGLPLPYFIALKIAQDIIDNMKKILRI